jgi:hypothetical protein
VFSPTLIKPDQSGQPPAALGAAQSPPLDRQNSKQLLLLKLLVLLKANSNGTTGSAGPINTQNPVPAGPSASGQQGKPSSNGDKMPTPPHLKDFTKDGSPNMNISVSSFAQQHGAGMS